LGRQSPAVVLRPGLPDGNSAHRVRVGARGPAALEQMVSLADGNPSGTDKIFSRDVLMSQAAGPVHHPGRGEAMPSNANMAKDGSAEPSSVAGAAKYQRRIGATKTERVGKHHIHLTSFRAMRHEIDGRLDRWVIQIQCGWHHSIAHCEN
jgi:hypothetical protein